MTYTLHLSRDGERNFSRINPFSVVPCRLTLDAGAEAVIDYFSCFDSIVNAVIGRDCDFQSGS